MKKQVGFNLVYKELNNANVINFGGNCHAGYFIKKSHKSPFQGLGIPTSVLPSFLKSDWQYFFDIKNLIIFKDAVRDIKYNINSFHHFDLEDSIENQLPKFKIEFLIRWKNLLEHIKNPNNFIIYNEYYPLWCEDKKQCLQEAVHAILGLQPKAQLIVVCEDKKQIFDNAVTVIRNPKDDENADLWGYVTRNIEQRNFYSGRRYFFHREKFI